MAVDGAQDVVEQDVPRRRVDRSRETDARLRASPAHQHSPFSHAGSQKTHLLPT